MPLHTRHLIIMGKLKVYYYNVNRLISYWAALVFNPLLAAASFNVATTDHLTLSLHPIA